MLSRSRAATRNVSHLLVAGWNPLAPPGRSSAAQSGQDRQSVSNPTLATAPLATWLASVGREQDVEGGYRVAHVAGGAGHQVVSYKNYEGTGARCAFQSREPVRVGRLTTSPPTDRIFALGRNEAGQLGVGFASQEGTRGLVEGFEGEEVLAVKAGVQASYILVRDEGASQEP